MNRTLTLKSKRIFQDNLLAWYRECKRSLPWRGTRDPYRIWISEILLQQTRVSTAMAYYERFLQRFPTLADLADAPLEAILQVWQGLGYYGRARNLHRAARVLKEEYDGKIPCEPETLQSLPGIGPYTAAAVASIAFGKDVAVLDGNVTRVVIRAYGIEEYPGHPSSRGRLQGIADRLLPKGDAAQFNQALMELGALVCTPARPRCSTCPLNRICAARKKKLVEQLPVRSPKARVPVRVRVVAAVVYRGMLLFQRRPAKGLLGGLWELPGVYLKIIEGNEEGFRRLMKLMKDVVTIQRPPGNTNISLKHAYSHFHESLVVFPCKGLRTGKPSARRKREQTYRWIHPTHLGSYPITGATRKIMQRLEQEKADQEPSSRGKR